MSLVRKLMYLVAVLVAGGCGFGDPDYLQYSDADSSAGETDGTEQTAGTGDGELTCAEQVLAAFGLVQSAINNTCGNAGCHGDGTGGGLTLTPGDAAASEAALAAYVGGNANKLITQLSEGSGHTGGAQIPASLSASAVTSWQSAKSCE